MQEVWSSLSVVLFFFFAYLCSVWKYPQPGLWRGQIVSAHIFPSLGNWLYFGLSCITTERGLRSWNTLLFLHDFPINCAPQRGEGGRLSRFNESGNNPPASAPLGTSPLRSAISAAEINYFFITRGNSSGRKWQDAGGTVNIPHSWGQQWHCLSLERWHLYWINARALVLMFAFLSDPQVGRLHIAIDSTLKGNPPRLPYLCIR